MIHWRETGNDAHTIEPFDLPSLGQKVARKYFYWVERSFNQSTHQSIIFPIEIWLCAAGHKLWIMPALLWLSWKSPLIHRQRRLEPLTRWTSPSKSFCFVSSGYVPRCRHYAITLTIGLWVLSNNLSYLECFLLQRVDLLDGDCNSTRLPRILSIPLPA